jgi:hypothetical protein
MGLTQSAEEQRARNRMAARLKPYIFHRSQWDKRQREELRCNAPKIFKQFEAEVAAGRLRLMDKPPEGPLPPKPSEDWRDYRTPEHGPQTNGLEPPPLELPVAAAVPAAPVASSDATAGLDEIKHYLFKHAQWDDEVRSVLRKRPQWWEEFEQELAVGRLRLQEQQNVSNEPASSSASAATSTASIAAPPVRLAPLPSSSLHAGSRQPPPERNEERRPLLSAQASSACVEDEWVWADGQTSACNSAAPSCQPVATEDAAALRQRQSVSSPE